MAVLLGNNGTAVNTTITGASGVAYWHDAGYTAVGGTMATAHIEFNSTNAGQYAKIIVWDSGGVVVGTSAAIEAVAGEQSATITTDTLTNGSTYYLGVVTDFQLTLSSVDAVAWSTDEQANNYTTPANLSIPGTSKNRYQPRIWIEDSGVGITVSPATIVDGGTTYSLETTGMSALTSLKLRNKQDNNHIVTLTLTGSSSPYTFDSPDYKVNTNTTTGVDGCPFTTTYDANELFADDGTITAVANVDFNPATGWDEVKVSTTPDMTSASISENFNGYYEDITAVSSANPASLTITDHGFTNLQDITNSGLTTAPDDANGEEIFTLTDANSGTIAVDTTTSVTDGVGKAQTGKADEHGQFLFSTDDSGTMTVDGLYSHSKTVNHYVQYFDYVDSKMKAVLVTVVSGGEAGSTSLGLSLSIGL